jgi:hypothetical protein
MQNILRSSELLGFWTFSIVQYSREQKTRRFGNSICFHPQVKGEDTQLGPLEGTNLNRGTTPVRFTQLFNHLRPG